MISWITLVPFLAFVSYLIILLFSLEQLLKSRPGRFFSVYLFLAAVWALASWFMHLGITPSPLFWFKILLVCAFLLTPLIVNFALEFPSKKEKLSKAAFIWYIPALLLGILLFKNLLIEKFEFLPDTGGKVIIEFYPAMNILWAYTTISIILASIVYTYTYNKQKSPNKNVVLFPFLGSLLILISGFLNILPSLRPYPFDLAGNFIYSLLVAYAILRFQFLSPGAIFRKSSVYLLVALAFSAFVAVAVYYIQFINRDMPGWQLWIMILPLALLLAFIFGPARQKAQEVVDRTFFGEQYNYRKTIEGFNRKAASTLDLKELTISLVEMLNRVLKCPVALFFSYPKEEVLHLVEFAGFKVESPEQFFLLKSSPVAQWLVSSSKPTPIYLISNLAGPGEVLKADFKWVDVMGTELVCPLIFRDRLSGILVLGKKKGLYPYSDEDISLLSALGLQIAIALENSRLYLESQEAYKKLSESQEYLMRAERMRLLGEVSGGVAHDLNNLLAVISARSEINLALVDQPQARRNLEMVLKAAEDSARVVKRLHEFVKRPGDIVQDKLDINKLIMELLPMAEHRRAEVEQTRGVFLQMDYRLRAKSEILGNSSEIRQAITNILFNAFDAMPNGGRIDIQSQDKDEWVVVSIQDSGIGMTPEVKERIFNPFFTTKGEKGSGLGLSIVQAIVNKYGGKITFDTEAGKGTTFYLSFPVAGRTVVQREAEMKGQVAVRSSAKILVIEDNIELGEAINFFLNQAGYHSALTHDGNDGLAQFQKDDFNLVVTDWGLSPMTGGDVAYSIKAMNRKVPIIVITGWELDLSPTTVKEMGIVDVIIKPFSKEEFLNRIARILASSS